ncbi:hypothetical protein J6590_023622 [Homalodisca vitripennis]|nr:hypothetical protein J6590_023622 [Homalodisca vitripennis]
MEAVSNHPAHDAHTHTHGRARHQTHDTTLWSPDGLLTGGGDAGVPSDRAAARRGHPVWTRRPYQRTPQPCVASSVVAHRTFKCTDNALFSLDQGCSGLSNERSEIITSGRQNPGCTTKSVCDLKSAREGVSPRRVNTGVHSEGERGGGQGQQIKDRGRRWQRQGPGVCNTTNSQLTEPCSTQHGMEE